MRGAKAIWRPSPDRVKQANITKFTLYVNERWGLSLADYRELYDWSIKQPELFWRAVWDFCEVRGEMGGTVLREGEDMARARWFPEARLNFAENLLRKNDQHTAIVFQSEDKIQRKITHAELWEKTSLLARAMRRTGIKAGDRVAAFMPNMPETVMAMLAAHSLGAIWSSCSPDFGVRGVLDRFRQIKPKLLFCADGYYYNGKYHNSLEKLPGIMSGLPELRQTVIVPFGGGPFSAPADAVSLADFTAQGDGGEIDFTPLPFNHPLCIVFSSGTTGIPKCIVHGAGGVLLQHLKEHRLHTDLKPGDRLFFFTTCGWMMWNWLVSGLASEATLMLYDGSPFAGDGDILFDYAQREKINIFGVSAKYIDGIRKKKITPAKSHNLGSLRTVLSTGSPLMPENFDFAYAKIKKDICLSSISGGTDILSCFLQGSPTLPVHRGQLQCPGLGMKVEIFNEQGKSMRGKKGELVCTAPFPSMPLGFWGDESGEKYRACYFSRFPGCWHQGDYAERTEEGGFIIYGRSDATLNPGGVRIGTAEIYRQVEQMDEVMEGLVIGQNWKGDTRVVLFVVLGEGITLDEKLAEKIRQKIRSGATPRHVPAKIIPVADIPRTKTGKIAELAVRDTVENREVKNKGALANPKALDLYRGIPALAED